MRRIVKHPLPSVRIVGGGRDGVSVLFWMVPAMVDHAVTVGETMKIIETAATGERETDGKKQKELT